MAVRFQDYYATLGVSRDATQEEIKKAFRRLARQHHPDLAKDKKAAEEKFKEINEAYEVLSDPEKRRRYDELGSRWQDGAEFQPPPRHAGSTRRGRAGTAEDFEFHFGGTGFSDFFEQFFAHRRRASRPFAEEDFTEFPDQTTQGIRGSDIEGDILVTLDEIVSGAVRPITLQRIDPRTGHAEKTTFNARIPAGVRDGQTIRARGKGSPGVAGGPPGDLYLRVRVAAHPDFRVQGADLYHDVDLAPWDAVLGTTVNVPTLGPRINVRIPPGTKQGRQLRVRSQGLPKGSTGERGDLYVVVNIDTPSEITETERKAWEELRRVSQFNPRQG